MSDDLVAVLASELSQDERNRLAGAIAAETGSAAAVLTPTRVSIARPGRALPSKS